ncbi:double-stranded RNA-binding protein 2, partial [Tanacetum coccineum]
MISLGLSAEITAVTVFKSGLQIPSVLGTHYLELSAAFINLSYRLVFFHGDCLPLKMYVREGPDHAPRFKALVNFNGDSFESPNYFTTLRQAEHAAAEVALSSLSSHSLAARIL